MASKSAFDQGKRIHNNQTLKQDKPKITGEVKYADAPAVKPDKSKKLSDVREKFAKNADKPTTASEEAGQKNLPSIIKKIDPEGRAQVLPELYQQMQQMMGIMSMGSGGGGGGGGQNGSPSNPPSGTTAIMQDSFTGCLAILTRSYGFERVIEVFTDLLSNGGINKVDARFTKIVQNALSNLIKLALYFGPINIPVSVYNKTIYGDIVPSPLVDISKVPDFYVKQYFPFDQDPYPGFIKWVYSDGSILWTKREPNSYYFETSSEEVFSVSERELATDLSPYVKIENPVTPFTVEIFNSILIKQVDNIEENTLNNSVGNNSGGQGSGGGNNMAGALGGQLQSLMGMLTGQQLPLSVLNQGEVNNVMQQFQKDMGLNNQLFQMANGALGGGMGGLSSLMNMGGLSNIMGGFGMGGGGIGGILGNLTGGSGLLGNFGGFGGNSGGGGGGAGSGFPTAGFGDYSGGQITNNGLKNIEDLLKLLGIK